MPVTIYRCSACGRTYVAVPGYCRCGGQEFQTLEASGRGQVYTCTTLYASAERFEKDLPFQLALVELEEGARLMARITGAAVGVGDHVSLVDQRDGVYYFSRT
jgi:hypothetical protein